MLVTFKSGLRSWTRRVGAGILLGSGPQMKNQKKP